jgi:DNA-binding transcriptional LysR family regulator
MDFRHLRTFVTVAEHGTVSKAALRLRIAQPALSRQISILEQELGVRLFDRIRRRLVLTGEGEQLLEECRSILGSVSSLAEHAELLRRGDKGVLKVAATPLVIDGIFSTFLHRYGELSPGIEIKLREADGASMLPMLERGEIHLAIGSVHGMGPGDHPFGIYELQPLEVMACCNLSLQLGNGGTIEIGRLAPHPLLLLESGFLLRNTFDAACRLAGLKPRVLIEGRAPHTLLALAEAGHGVAVVASVLPTHRYKLKVFRLAHRRKPLKQPLLVVWDKRRPLPRYAEEFCDALALYMRRVFPITRASRKASRGPVRKNRLSVVNDRDER